MTSDRRAREYLLGTLNEDERDALEREYFSSGRGLERVSEAEEELVEDYLDGRLAADDREQFEREYLASPVHRTRVETIRQLIERARSESPRVLRPRRWSELRWLALAAAAVLLLAAAIWSVGERQGQLPQAEGTTTAARPTPPALSSTPQQSTPPTPTTIPSVFAVELTPLAVRSAGDTSRVVIPAGTDLVDLRLEIESGLPTSRDLSVGIARVAGGEVWRGAATRERQAARVRVPASALPAEDYIVTLHTGRAETRYFLRVRAK